MDDDDSIALSLPIPIPKEEVGIVKYILTSLPISLIYKLRDSGVINILNDVMVSFIGIGLLFTKPSLLLDFLTLSKKIKIFKYGNSRQKYLEIFNTNINKNKDNNDNDINKDILLFVHGGAWGSGKPWMYRLIASGLAILLNCKKCIVIGYPVYPYGSILDQASCIYESIKYIKNNEKEILIDDNYDNVNNNYILCGHSSGSNICALAILNSIANRDKLKLVETFIGLSGPYDIEKHYLWESARRVHEISPMKPAACDINNFYKCSPTILLQRNILTIFGSNNNNTNTEIYEEEVKRLFPFTVLVHGIQDDIVPYTSTSEFSEQLTRKKVSNELIYFNGDHANPILDFMKKDSTHFKTKLSNLWLRYKKINIC